MMAAARAAPSMGSVPAPSSSKRISVSSSASPRMPTMFTMWEENVDKLWAMDCSSPTSASTRRNTFTRLSSETGICRPHWRAFRRYRPRSTILGAQARIR